MMRSAAALLLGIALLHAPAHAQQRSALSSIARSHYELGMQYMRTGLNDKALDEFNNAANADTSFIDAHLMAANLNVKLGRLREALPWYQTITRLDRRRADVYLTMGDIYRDLGDTPSSRVAYINSLAIDPNQPRVILSLAQMAMKANDFVGAVQLLEGATILADDPAALSIRAYAEHRLGRLERAAELYRRVLARTPDNGEALLNLGILESARKNNDAALDYFVRAANVLSDKSVAYRYMGSVQIEMGRLKDATENLRKAVRLNSSDALARFKLAGVLLDLLMPAEALEHLEAIRATGANYRELPALLGRAYLAIGDPARARAELERANRENPNDTQIIIALAETLGRLGARREAIEMYEKAVVSDGVAPRVHRELAELYGQVGDAPKALRAERTYNELVAKAEITATIEAERRSWRARLDELEKTSERRVAAIESAARERAEQIQSEAAKEIAAVRAEADSRLRAVPASPVRTPVAPAVGIYDTNLEIARIRREADARVAEADNRVRMELERLRAQGGVSADARQVIANLETRLRAAEDQVRRTRSSGADTALVAEMANLGATNADVRKKLAELSAALEKERAVREEAVATAERTRAQSELAVREMNRVVDALKVEIIRGLKEIGAETAQIGQMPTDQLKYFVQNVRLAADARVARSQLQAEARLNDVRTRAESEVLEIMRNTQIQIDRTRAQAAEETHRGQLAAEAEVKRRVETERERLAAEALAKRLALAEQLRASIEADAQVRFLEEKSSIEATYEADRIRMQRDYDKQLEKFESEYQRRLEAAQLEAKRATEQIQALTRNDTALLMRSEVYQRIVRENAMLREDLAGARRRTEELGLERENVMREADGLRRELSNIQGRLGSLEAEARRYQGIAVLAEPLQRGVNINSATIDELQALPGIGVQEARNIIWYRENVGLFRGAEELVKVPGLEATKASAIKGLVRVR